MSRRGLREEGKGGCAGRGDGEGWGGVGPHLTRDGECLSRAVRLSVGADPSAARTLEEVSGPITLGGFEAWSNRVAGSWVSLLSRVAGRGRYLGVGSAERLRRV